MYRTGRRDDGQTGQAGFPEGKLVGFTHDAVRASLAPAKRRAALLAALLSELRGAAEGTQA